MLENLANGQWRYNADESNEFLYKERTLAAYLSAKKLLTEKSRYKLDYATNIHGRKATSLHKDKSVAVITDASIPRCT